MTILVIGYGNSLKSDDRAGQAVAQAVAGWANPVVRTRTVYDLSPHLVGDIATATVVVFVKAVSTASKVEQGLMVYPVSPQMADQQWGHACTPQMLLAIAEQRYDTLPQKSYWFRIPGETFTFGEQLSTQTQQGIQQALTQLSELVRSYEYKARARLRP